MRKKAVYPTKTSMNLYFKPDRTTRPATVARYALFALVCLLGLSKWLVYDLWMENQAAQRELAAAEEELAGVMVELVDYNEVQERYIRYSATEEEQSLVDRMEVLALLDVTMGGAKLDSVSISGNQVRVQLSNVTLAHIAEIVRNLEASPLVAGTVVNTAATTGDEYGVNMWGEVWYAEEEWDLVQGNILIQLNDPQTVQAEEEAQQG